MSRRILASSLKMGGAVLLSFLFLFANDRWRLFPNFLGTGMKEMLAVFQDPATQWMVFICLGMYYVALLSLQFRAEAAQCAERSRQLLCVCQRNALTICLIGVLLMGAITYASHYASSASALVLMAGAVIGQCTRFWASSSLEREGGNIQGNPILWSLLCLTLLLAVASVWNADLGYSYTYRSQNRWTGPWDNPNIFGLLMASGILIALGIVLFIFKFHPFGRTGNDGQKSEIGNYVCALACTIAIMLMLRGLLHSYSRGAWLAILCGIGYLAWRGINIRGSLVQGIWDNSLGAWLKRNWLCMGITLISAAVLVFWQFRQTQWHPARRVFSVARTEDFSWRNRLTAWEGALQIMADYPLAGAGWDQPKPLYQNHYLPAKETDGAAIEMNDYLMLGATLGIPALLAFGLFLWLSFTGPAEFGKAGGAEVTMKDWLQATCYAGAVVLLVGFWFDGGFFKLPTAVVFWMLMGLGAARIFRNQTASDQRTNGSLIASIWKNGGYILVTILLLLIGALFWAKGQDPFSRKSFRLETKEHGSFQCVAVLPKPVRRLPVVIYAHGWSENLTKDGDGLRQIAELGMAVVSFEYNQTNQSAFAPELESLLNYIEQQPWANSNEMAWVGFSMGANRMLEFVAGNPEIQPQLLVEISGAGLPEAPTNHFAGIFHFPVLLIHGKKDDVFPIADTERLMTVLQTNGVSVKLDVISGIGHGLEPERGVIFHCLGEYCQTHLTGENWVQDDHCNEQWRAGMPSLWLCAFPAIAWSAGWFGWLRFQKFSTLKFKLKLSRAEMAMRWLAVILVALALIETTVYLAIPQLTVSDRAISLARRFLVQPKELANFDYLAGQPVWQGQKLRLLLDNVELAAYNRGLINWELNDTVYRDYVLSPVISPSTNDSRLSGDLNSRRSLWEEIYPRIRHESSPENTARIVVRHLRERITIADSPDLPHSVPEIWLRHITDEKGFQIIYVAALRSVGVPARLNESGQVELYDGGWKRAPQPTVIGF